MIGNLILGTVKGAEGCRGNSITVKLILLHDYNTVGYKLPMDTGVVIFHVVMICD